MIPVYKPKTEGEAAVLASMFHAYGVDFVMQGGAFSSMYPGPLSNSLNEQVILVSTADFELAKQLIDDFLE